MSWLRAIFQCAVFKSALKALSLLGLRVILSDGKLCAFVSEGFRDLRLISVDADYADHNGYKIHTPSYPSGSNFFFFFFLDKERDSGIYAVAIVSNVVRVYKA